MIRYSIFIFIIVCLSGCMNDIFVEQPDYESKVVVDGWIENGDYAHVILTKSSPFLTHYDSASIRNTFLNYAKVTVTNNKGESEILTLVRKEEFFPPFIYKSVMMRGELGGVYDLKIEVEGKLIESTTSIPELPELLNVTPLAVSDTTMDIEVLLSDDIAEDRYYYSEIKVKGIDTNFHPSSYPLHSNKSFSSVREKIKVLRSNQPDPLGIYGIDDNRNIPRYEFLLSDTVYLKFARIDKASFNVLNDLYIDQLNSQNPFSFVHKKTNTNITGGIGRWTGLGTKNYIVMYSDW
ncbi:DUF4249 family protein [Labilibacter sediminis]|nr:DUF4249 family protein [Labilibacter sediminis]